MKAKNNVVCSSSSFVHRSFRKRHSDMPYQEQWQFQRRRNPNGQIEPHTYVCNRDENAARNMDYKCMCMLMHRPFANSMVLRMSRRCKDNFFFYFPQFITQIRISVAMLPSSVSFFFTLKFHVSNPIIPRLYTQLKLHKPGMKLRPITPNIDAPNERWQNVFWINLILCPSNLSQHRLKILLIS